MAKVEYGRFGGESRLEFELDLAQDSRSRDLGMRENIPQFARTDSSPQWPCHTDAVEATQNAAVSELAQTMVLGALLTRARERWGSFEILDHWQQGEFHHDVVLRVVDGAPGLPGSVLVVATNCNGGVKEVLCFAQPPERFGLWHARCPENPEFAGALPDILAAATTPHWFNPCELLLPNARSEYREEFREKQCGGGWVPRRG
jgi:hypothetical protein